MQVSLPQIIISKHNLSIFDPLNSFIEEKKYSSLIVLVDTNTEKSCLPLLKKNLKFDFKTIVIPAGESNKNDKSLIEVWNKLTAYQIDRKSLLINLGGGMITDLGGFAAATYKRGIDFINIPTSMLAMVDAAIGGKTGIDFNGLKNQIGVFAHPKMVLMEPEFLKTLPKREFISGLAEVIKYGFIQDKKTVTYFETQKEVPHTIPDDLIQQSVAVKMEIVEKDPKEKNIRKSLNFGHTLGHAIETHLLADSKRNLLHGEAVAIGMILALQLSVQTQSFDVVKAISYSKMLNRFFPKVLFTEKDIQSIIDLLKHDKKNYGDQVNFVLLKDIGKVVLDCQVTEAQIRKAFESYQNL